MAAPVLDIEVNDADARVVQTAPPVEVAAVESPSPGLCRLFNAAALDAGFCAWLLTTPTQAAAAAAHNAGAALGCTHGDPVLSLPPLPLTAAELALVRRARGARSLGEAWRRIVGAPAALGAADA